MGLFDNLGDPLTMATLGSGLANGYNQGYLGASQRSFQQALQMGQMQALNAYHMGMVGNGQQRNNVTFDKAFGVGPNGSPILGPDGQPVAGTNQTSAFNANTRREGQQGYTDASGNFQPGTLQLRGDFEGNVFGLGLCQEARHSALRVK